MTDRTGADGDTVKLLKECDSGIKMGISAIDDIIDDVKNTDFRTLLHDSKTQHEKLKDEILVLLNEHNDDGKNPNPMAKGMSWVKTNMKMAVDGTDNTAADLITDGCNMGVKSLSRYLNQYKSADSKSRDITFRFDVQRNFRFLTIVNIPGIVIWYDKADIIAGNIYCT